MNVTKGIKWSDLDADSEDFVMTAGGKFLLAVSAASFGSNPISIAMKAPDGNYVPVVCFTTDGTNNLGVTGAVGSAIMDLPPGTYKLDVGDSTAVYVTLTSVPY